MDTLLTADQVIDQALMARSEQAVLDRAMFDRSALERTAAITLQRAAMHAAQTEHTSPTGSMHEIHETSPLHDRVSAAGPFNLHQGEILGPLLFDGDGKAFLSFYSGLYEYFNMLSVASNVNKPVPTIGFV